MVEEAKLKLKEWGNSLGIIIPKEIIIKENLHPNEEIVITIGKEKDLASIFGKGKGLKINTQKMKDEGRKIWKMN